MTPIKTAKKPSPTLQNRLEELEAKAGDLGIAIHYDRLEAAGLKLKEGLCRVRGEYHIYIEKRKATSEKIRSLIELLDRPLPEIAMETQDD
jgi:hypothetical protein